MALALLLPAMLVPHAQAQSHGAATPQWRDAAPRRSDEGRGPFKRMILRNAMIVDGTGGPVSGPTTLIVRGDRIESIGGDATPGPGDEIIDVAGGYVLPGLVDTHVRVLDEASPSMPPDYALKLLMAHGITTITSMQAWPYVGWALNLQKQSAANAIVAPRIQVWADVRAPTEKETRAMVREAKARGVAGLGEGSVLGPPDLIRAGLDEAAKLGMNSSWHMNFRNCPRFNALDAAKAGLHGLSHWYCLPEVLFEGRRLQDYPADYSFSDVNARFRESGRLWRQAAAPGSEKWDAVIEEFLALDFTFEPTFSVYEANRDVMGVSNAQWLDDYLHPTLRKTFVPSTTGLFSHFYDWSSTDEASWRQNFQIWMRFVNDYKNRGGRVVAGADAGYMWTIPGFGYVRNLEMLEEAGFTPLEVIHAATLAGAEHLRMQQDVGSIEPGKYADLVILDRNPLQNLKALYGTGYPGLQADGTVAQVGGVRYTVKGGLVYDAPALLADVARLVAEAKRAAAAEGTP